MKQPLFNEEEDQEEIVLAEHTADQMLGNIFKACDVTPNAIPLNLLQNWGQYQKTGFQKGKVICVVMFLLLLLFPLFILQPMVEFEKQASDKTVNYVIYVKSPLPIVSIRAELNNETIPVSKIKYNHYETTPTENGNLSIEATLLNGQTKTSSIEVDAFDTTSPIMVGHEVTDKELKIYVQDDDSGVNYQEAYAIASVGSRIEPIATNEAQGEIIFLYEKKETLNVFVPDKRNNVLQVVFSDKTD